MNVRNLDPREKGRARPEPNDELRKIHIGMMPKKFMFIKQELLEAIKAELIDLLRRNVDLLCGH